MLTPYSGELPPLNHPSIRCDSHNRQGVFMWAIFLFLIFFLLLFFPLVTSALFWYEAGNSHYRFQMQQESDGKFGDMDT